MSYLENCGNPPRKEQAQGMKRKEEQAYAAVSAAHISEYHGHKAPEGKASKIASLQAELSPFPPPCIHTYIYTCMHTYIHT